MWTYAQKTGLLTLNDLKFHGYSGHGEGYNNPAMQDKHGIGPLPCGIYDMTTIYDAPPLKLGPKVIVLIARDPSTQFGRDGFRIHGDNMMANRTASDGCIVIPGVVNRLKIWDSNDHVLQVVSGIRED